MPFEICPRSYVNCGCYHSPPENVRHSIEPPAPSPESETDEVALAAAQLLGVELPPAPPPTLRKTRCRYCNRLRRKAEIVILDQPLRSEYQGIVAVGAKVCRSHFIEDYGEPLRLCDDCNHYGTTISVRMHTEGSPSNRILCTECQPNYSRCSSCSFTFRRDGMVNIVGNRFCTSCAPRYWGCPRCRRLANAHDRVNNPQYGRETCRVCWESIYNHCERCEIVYEIDRNAEFPGLCTDCAPNPESNGFPWEDYHDGRAHICDAGDSPEAINFILIPRRKFGVELEFSQGGQIAGKFIARRTNWGACPDGTSGVVQEFKSPPMAGDEGLQNVERFCELAQKCSLAVSRQCGFHLHIDMGGESSQSLLRIAGAYAAFLPLWRCFVPPSRRNNHFCNADRVTNGSALAILTAGKSPWRNSDGSRYCAMNWKAYHRHKTGENRLHTGTMNASKVINWIRANVQFTEWAKQTPPSELLELDSASAPEKFRYLRDKGVWATDVAEFYRQRARKFGVDLLSNGSGAGEIIIPPGPVGPEFPGWEWTEEDYRAAADYIGIRISQVTPRLLRDAFRVGRLERKPIDIFAAEIKAGVIAGYVENTSEQDP